MSFHVALYVLFLVVCLVGLIEAIGLVVAYLRVQRRR